MLVNRKGRAFASLAAGGHVQGDPIQPRVKRAGALERAQFDIRLDKGILAHVAPLFSRTGYVHQRVIQPVLITSYKPSKGRRVSVECFVNEGQVVVHGCSKRWTPKKARKFRSLPAGISGALSVLS